MGLTNREYMDSLSNEELAKYLHDEPWTAYANHIYFSHWIKYEECIKQWLDSQHEEE